MIPKIESAEQIYHFFPHNPEDIEKKTDSSIQEIENALEQLYAIDEDTRTLENTLYAFDKIATQYHVISSLLYAIEAVYPEELMRQAAHHNQLKLQSYGIDALWQNKRLYEILYDFNERHEQDLNEKRSYFLQEQLKAFERYGAHLQGQHVERLKNILKELSEHTLAFERNIAADIRSIKVTLIELEGLPESFIAGLKNEGDTYILTVDYPTYFFVMENCTVETTRAALWHEFVNRAYPINEKELQQIIALRDELAVICGYESYAALDIEPQMAKTPARVEQFILSLVEQSQGKLVQELKTLSEHLPKGVSLTENGKFKPWDFAYIKSEYKKKYFNVNEAAIAEYFPLEHTIEKLLGIYEEFLGVTFKKSHLNIIWHEHVEYIKVYKGDKYIGSLLMDLFPRPGKYTHACHITLVPTFEHHKDFYPALSLVIANFPMPQEGKPALLPRSDVITFFHEFGHAIHGLFGTTEFGLVSGTSVKHDFVEMPSQMLEEWMWDSAILKKVSKHYKTNEALPDSIIKGIAQARTFDSGYWIQRQVYYSLLSLHCYMPGEFKDVNKMHNMLYKQLFPYIEYQESNHDYASFGHLTGYAAKYYGYLWSKVYALDLYNYIYKHGLLNPVIGTKYLDIILKNGGSVDPELLLEQFLGRKPSIESFAKTYGLKVK